MLISSWTGTGSCVGLVKAIASDVVVSGKEKEKDVSFSEATANGTAMRMKNAMFDVSQTSFAMIARTPLNKNQKRKTYKHGPHSHTETVHRRDDGIHRVVLKHIGNLGPVGARINHMLEQRRRFNHFGCEERKKRIEQVNRKKKGKKKE